MCLRTAKRHRPQVTLAVHIEVFINPDDTHEWQVWRLEEYDTCTPKPFGRQNESERPQAKWDQILGLLALCSAMHAMFVV